MFQSTYNYNIKLTPHATAITMHNTHRAQSTDGIGDAHFIGLRPSQPIKPPPNPTLPQVHGTRIKVLVAIALLVFLISINIPV